MKRNLSPMHNAHYDVLIIGGGINGAAIANIASLNGLKVALFEKGDFAGGTSSKSTKLIHGGLRYLENLEFDLVQESLKERSVQINSAPHLVKPLGFIIPVYRFDKRPLWLMELGVWLYDFLSGRHKVNSYRRLSAGEVMYFAKDINPDGLLGGLIYYDAQMDDARLCLENVLQAKAQGAHVANYAAVQDIIKENGKAVGARVYDEINKETFTVTANHVVAAAGPWTNEIKHKENAHTPIKIRPTKGVHIVYKDTICDHALFITARNDDRIFFIIPFKGNTLIGTTDTDFDGSPDKVDINDEDIDYLFKESKRVFPDKTFSRDNIITTFVGLRPLVSKKGSPSKLSRKHIIEKTFSGTLYVTGGKYTTYRKIAEDVVKRFKKNLKDTTQLLPLYGGGALADDLEACAQEFNLPLETLRTLAEVYGNRYRDVLALGKSDPSLLEPICSCSPTIKAQVVYALKTEMARTSEDIIERRLSLHFLPCPKETCRKLVQKMVEEM